MNRIYLLVGLTVTAASVFAFFPQFAEAAGQDVSIFGKNSGGQQRPVLTNDAGVVMTSITATISSATTETLVPNSSATSTPMFSLAGRRSIAIQNIGPNAIFCRCDGVAPVVNKAFKISAGDPPLAMDCSDVACPCKCIAATADQVTGGATIVTEIK